MGVEGLRNELIKQFKPVWMINDSAHHEQHFENVYATGCVINERLNLGYDRKLILLAAYLHDLFAWSRENHHRLSHQFVMTSESSVFEGIDTLERWTVAMACMQHRASFDGKFSNGFSELFNSADRERPVSAEAMLQRAILFRKDRSPQMSEDEVIVSSIKHIKDKFGANGYARYPNMYLEVFGEELARVQQQIAEL